MNIRNQIFSNFLDFYQNSHENQINSNLRDNNQSNNLISENDIRSQNNLEANLECKSNRTAGGESKILLNNSNTSISKQINNSPYNNYTIEDNLNNNNKNNIINIKNNHNSIKFIKKIHNNNNNCSIKKENEPKTWSYSDSMAEKINNNNPAGNSDQTRNFSQIIIENESNYDQEQEENMKANDNQSNFIQNELSSHLKNHYEENFENPDNTITSMDLVSDYSRKLNREFNNDNSQIIRNIQDAKEERHDYQYQVFEIKDKIEENVEHERTVKAIRGEADKDTTYNLSEDSS